MSITAGAAYTGREIIDSTQYAIAQATTAMHDVSAAVSHSHEALPFYMEAEFWVGMSFVTVVLFLARPISRLLKAMIDKRIEGIKARIQEASDLFDDAQKLLSDYEKKYRNAKKEAQAILEKSQKQIEYIKNANLSKLEQDTRTKEKDAEDRIKSSLANANKELTDMTATLAIRITKQAINDNLSPQAQNKLIDRSISAIGNLK